MSDLISRQDVIKAVLGSNLSACMVYGRSEEGMATANELIQAIKNLPSAEPERKSGHWINAECKDGTTAHKCSECKCFVGYSVSSLKWFNFCPWCGADMRGGRR